MLLMSTCCAKLAMAKLVKLTDRLGITKSQGHIRRVCEIRRHFQFDISVISEIYPSYGSFKTSSKLDPVTNKFIELIIHNLNITASLLNLAI